jgi:hypothetical protein
VVISFGRGLVYLNKLDFLSPKDDLTNFDLTLSAKKEVPLHLNKFESPRIICAKYDPVVLERKLKM